MLYMIGFNSVLSVGVMGVVFSVVFGALLTSVNLTLDTIMGMTACGSNWYLVFSR